MALLSFSLNLTDQEIVDLMEVSREEGFKSTGEFVSYLVKKRLALRTDKKDPNQGELELPISK